MSSFVFCFCFFFYSLKGTYSQKLTSRSNGHSDWPDTLPSLSLNTPDMYQNGVLNRLPVWAPRPHLFFFFSLKGTPWQNHRRPQIHQKWCLAKTNPPNDFKFWSGLPLNTPDVYQKWPLKPVAGLSSPSSFLIFLKGHTFSKIDARLKPELWLASYSGQVFPTTPQTCTQNGVYNLLPAWNRLHYFF